MKSNEPQNINKDVWYYENDKTLHFIHWVNGTCHEFKVRISKLKKSIKRIEAKEREIK